MAAILGFTQAARALKITTPLGDDALLLRAVTGNEAISQLFRFQLDLVSEDESLDLSAIVGKNVTLSVETLEGERAFNGFISRFAQGGRDERFTYYRAEMVPWFWFLTRTADCRIFQEKSAPEIIQKIFGDLGFKDFELRLYGSYRKRDYCVQYRETDFNFVSRLMEEEGIAYFFQHDAKASKHTMVLADDAGAHQPCPNQATASCDFSMTGWRADDRITEWRIEQEFRPGAWAHTDYNFETPSTSLLVSVKDKDPYEIYDYPGFYSKRADGDKLAKTRLQEATAFEKRATGKSNCRNFNCGFVVEVQDHYRKDVNQKWLLTAVYHQASMGGSYDSGGEDQGFFYTNTFESVPATVPFRPPRVTPKPHVQGCQTAVVVGPAGEEIYTDKYGRIKVQFHWDREGGNNEKSSCWVRVSYPWAGKGWGGIHIPRIGQEVVVDFLEGDPDQPIIMGRVYHAESMPPWGLPDKKTISGFMSDSTKGGGGYNEISMDDTKGNELINVHAQYDQANKVEHDERTTIGNDRTENVGHNETITIGNDRTEQVVQNERITIGSNRTEVVGSNETITIGSNRTEVVGSNETINIGSNRMETVGANEMVTIALTRTRNVGINDMLNVGAAQEVSVGGLQAITVGAARMKTIGLAESVRIGMNQNVGIGQSRNTSVGNNDSLKVGNNVGVDAGDQILLKTGASSIVLKKDGTIAIEGRDIILKASNKILIKASDDVIVRGSKIGHN